MAKEDNRELRVTNVNPKLKEELGNIAANLGIQRSPLLKMKLKEIADSYPPEMKKKRLD